MNSAQSDEYISMIKRKLQNFDDSNDQLDGLTHFTGLLGAASRKKKEFTEVIDIIIKILQESPKVKLRIKAAQALGNLALESNLVLPTLDRVMWLDKSLHVREVIPIAMVHFGEESLKYLENALLKGKNNVRLNAIRALGRINKNNGKIISILKKYLQKTQDKIEIFWISISLINLQGIESEGINIIKKLIAEKEISDNLIFRYKLEIHRLNEEAQFKQKGKRKKEKWYSRKDFIQFFFQDLIIFNSSEKGFDFQSNYSEFIRSIIITIFLNTITVESLTNFPKRGNIPEEIIDTLEDDLYKLKRKLENYESSDNIDLDYVPYSETFTYIRLIQYLSYYNLDFINEKIQNNSYDEFNVDGIKDIFSGYFIEEIINPGEPIKSMKFHEDRFWETKGKEIIDSWKEIFRFDYYLYQQCLVSLIAYFESYLVICVKTLNEFSLNSYFHKNHQKFVEPKDFDNLRPDEKIRCFINLELIGNNWKNGNEDFENIINAFWSRNRIVHKKELNNITFDKLSKIYIEELISSIAKISNELYNNIAKKLKDMN